MNKVEFAEVMGFLTIAIGQPLHQDETMAKKRLDIFFGMLSDLPLEALRLAAQQLILQRKWASFPQVGEIRDLATNIVHKLNALPDAGEAWDLARRTALTLGDESLDYKIINGEQIPATEFNRRKLAKLPAAVAEALRQFGPDRICNTPNDQIGTAFAQFRSIYEACAAKVRENRLLPESVRRGIDRAAMPATLTDAVRKIGVEP